MYIVSADGRMCGRKKNPAVPQELLAAIYSWMREGAHYVDIITRFRPKTVPNGYKPHSWNPGKLLYQ